MTNPPALPLFLRADWDPTVAAWIATSEDQPDFALQAPQLDALVRKVEQRTATAPPLPPCCISPRRTCRN